MSEKQVSDFERAIMSVAGASDEPKLFTSYWGNAKRLQADGVVLVSVCQFPPRFVTNFKSMKALAPSGAMLKGLKAGTVSREQFREEFDSQLEKLDPKKMYDQLMELGGGKSVAILCYEKPPESCHRHRVARWLDQALGMDIEEYPYGR